MISRYIMESSMQIFTFAFVNIISYVSIESNSHDHRFKYLVPTFRTTLLQKFFPSWFHQFTLGSFSHQLLRFVLKFTRHGNLRIQDRLLKKVGSQDCLRGSGPKTRWHCSSIPYLCLEGFQLPQLRQFCRIAQQPRSFALCSFALEPQPS